MQNVAICFCLIFFLIGYLCEPIKINPVTVFFGEWAIILFLASLNLYSILEASDYIYSYIFLGCLFFGAGFYLTRNLNLKFKIGSNSNSNSNWQIKVNTNILYFLIIISLCFFILDSLTAIIALLNGGSLDLIRKSAQEGVQYNFSAIVNAFRILIATPMSFVVMPLAAIEIFKENKNKFIIVSAFIIAILRVIGDGGRTPFIFLGLCIIVCYHYQSEKRLIKKLKQWDFKLRIKKRTITYLIIGIIGVIVLYWMTISRSGENTIRYTYYYFAMEPIMFEKWAKQVDSASLYGYGAASFNGFLFPLFYIFANIFRVNYPSGWRRVYDIIERVGTDWQVITSRGLTANSYASAFWNLYLDGRLFGIVIGMFIYGCVAATVYKNVINAQNEKNLSIFCLFMLGVFYSFQFMIFENIYYSIAYLILQFIIYKKYRSIN